MKVTGGIVESIIIIIVVFLCLEISADFESLEKDIHIIATHYVYSLPYYQKGV